MFRLDVFILIIFVISYCLCVNSIVYARSYTYFASQDEKFKELFIKGEKYLDNQQYEEAIKVLEEAYKINPKQMQVIGNLCFCYSQVEKYDKMQEYAKKGLLIAQNQISKDNIGRFYGYLGNSYKVLGNYNEAIKNLQLAIYNKPYYVDNYLSLAYCYNKSKHYNSVLETYDLIKNQFPEFYEKNNLELALSNMINNSELDSSEMEHLELGLKYRVRKNYSASINEYKQILKKKPEDITSLSEIIRNEWLRDSDNYDEIKDYCFKLIKILNRRENKKSFRCYEIAYKGLGFCYKKQNNLKLLSESEKLLKSIDYLISLKDDDSFGNLEKYINGYKAAVDCISDLEELPYNYMALDELIELLFNINKNEETQQYIKLGINQAKKEKNNNKLAKYSKDIATYFNLKDNYDQAIKYYKKGLSLTSDEDDKFKFCYGIAISYSALGDIQESLKYFEECKKYFKEDSVEMISDLDSSIVKCKALLDDNSDLFKANRHLDRGNDYLEKEKYEEAIDEYAKSLQYVPQRLFVLQKLSIGLHHVNNVDSSEEVDLEGFSVSVRDHEYSYLDYFAINLGNYYYEKEDYRRAIYYYKYVSKDNPIFKHKNVLFLIGTSYLLLKEIDKAVEAYEEAYKLDPSDKEVEKQLKLCRQLLNRE